MHAIQGGVSVDILKTIFSPHLDGMDQETVELLKKVKIVQPLLPGMFVSDLHKKKPFIFTYICKPIHVEEVKLAPFIPSVKASNNWVVSSSLTKSGAALQCNDPHLETSRLPAVWYEVVYHYSHPCMHPPLSYHAPFNSLFNIAKNSNEVLDGHNCARNARYRL